MGHTIGQFARALHCNRLHQPIKEQQVVLSSRWWCGAMSNKPQVLLVKEVRQFEQLWLDRGCGRTVRDGAFFRPLPDKGYHSLGDVARPYHADQPILTGERPVYAVAEKDPLLPHFLRKPIDYNLIWNTSGTKCRRPMSIWMPVPPPGFVSLGCVVSKDHNKPSLECVRSLVLSATLPGENDYVWRDKGSGGKYDVSIYDIHPAELDKEYAQTSGCFMAVGHYETPTAAAYALDRRSFITTMEDAIKTPTAFSPNLRISQIIDNEHVVCPKCQGTGSWGVFGGCDSASVHVICSTCPMCRGKRCLPRSEATLCSECDGLGGLSPFGKCDMLSLHFRPCKCMGTGLAAGI